MKDHAILGVPSRVFLDECLRGRDFFVVEPCIGGKKVIISQPKNHHFSTEKSSFFQSTYLRCRGVCHGSRGIRPYQSRAQGNTPTDRRGNPPARCNTQASHRGTSAHTTHEIKIDLHAPRLIDLDLDLISMRAPVPLSAYPWAPLAVEVFSQRWSSAIPQY